VRDDDTATRLCSSAIKTTELHERQTHLRPPPIAEVELPRSLRCAFLNFLFENGRKNNSIFDKEKVRLLFFIVSFFTVHLLTTPPVVHNARRRCDGGAQRDEEEEEPSHLREGIDG